MGLFMLELSPGQRDYIENMEESNQKISKHIFYQVSHTEIIFLVGIHFKLLGNNIN